MTDLSFSTALNIAKTAKKKFILQQYSQLNQLEQYAAKYRYNDYILKKQNHIRSIFGIETSLGCLDDLIIAEYELTSLNIHNTNINGQYEILVAKLINSMYNSNSSNFSTSIMGFDWSLAPQKILWSHLLGDNFVSKELRDMFGIEYFYNYDAYTLNQIIRKIHTLKGRKSFCTYYAEHRDRLYTHQMAPEIVVCYISNCRATERDISDIENYRGIIDGTETY
jgi:hypothetical protein